MEHGLLIGWLVNNCHVFVKMDMTSFLLLGFFIGMSHALESDHLAAVGTIASSGKATPKRLAALGASWGMGHTATLLLISFPVIIFGIALSDQIAAGMEFAVGVMLVGLALNVLRKMRTKKIHFHVHDHGDNKKHFHAHSHEGAKTPHTQDRHHHEHAVKFSLRAFIIGLAHGAAGSAGLLVLAASVTQNALTTILYILIFGLGSILGMVVLTYSASWPLRLAETAPARLFNFVQITVASVAAFVGIKVMIETTPIILGGI